MDHQVNWGTHGWTLGNRAAWPRVFSNQLEATVDEVAEFIQPHPTMTELFGETVLALTGRSLHG